MDYPSPIELTYPYYVNPIVLNDLIRGVELVVTHPRSILISGSLFTADVDLPVGEPVVIRAGSYKARLYLKHQLEEFDQWRAQRKQEQLLQQAQREERLKEERKQASIKFYAAHQIPFSFTIEVKEVLSGLSASSNGDGQRRNTVYHVYTQEAINLSRLKRKAGEFLCSPVTSRQGANWSDTLGKDTHRLPETIARIPTCKRCLELLERFRI